MTRPKRSRGSRANWPTRPKIRLKTDSDYDTDSPQNADCGKIGAVIHDAAARGFDLAADEYESARPGYPPDAVFWLVEQLGLSESSVLVDLAAGTGKLTRLLAPLVGRTVAVEPIAAMRARLHEVLPHVELVDGTAEAMPAVASGSVDAVTVAQAFHWFDAPRAAAEIARVLKPSGRVGLVWNRRLLDDPVQDAMEKIVARYRGSTPFHRASRWREEVEGTGLLRVVSSKEIPFTHELSREGLVARVASISFIAALPPAAKAEALGATRELAAGLREPIELPHTTEVWCLGPTSG
jgi:SAM-dependent methyltransferase